jgi:hypothetical protein
VIRRLVLAVLLAAAAGAVARSLQPDVARYLKMRGM